MGLNVSAFAIGAAGFQNDVVTDRQLLSLLAADGEGVHRLQRGDFFVAPTTGHNVVIGVAGAPSRAVIREETSPLIRGTYFAYSDAPDTIAAPVPAAQPFIATLILAVVDPQYGSSSGGNGARYVWMNGVPNASPAVLSDSAIATAFANPGGWIRLADVRINVADTGAIPAGQFTDRRVDLWGWKSYTPTWTLSPTTGTAATPGSSPGYLKGRWRRSVDNMVDVEFAVALGPAAYGGSNSRWDWNLPIACKTEVYGGRNTIIGYGWGSKANYPGIGIHLSAHTAFSTTKFYLVILGVALGSITPGNNGWVAGDALFGNLRYEAAA